MFNIGRLLSFCLIYCHTVFAFGQGERLLNQRMIFSDTNRGSASVYATIGYEFSSNKLTNAMVNGAFFEGSISNEHTVNVAAWKSDSKCRIVGSLGGEVWYNSAVKNNWHWLAGAGTKQLLLGDLKTGLTQLYLRGNAPFEDVDLPIGPSKISYHNFQFVGFGIEHQAAQLTFGGSLQLIKSARFYSAQLGTSSFYTAPYGTSISSELDVDYRASGSTLPASTAWYGTGASGNFWLAFQKHAKAPFIMVQVTDLGGVYFSSTSRSTFNDSITYQGIEINNILQLDDSLLSGGTPDSLASIIGFTKSYGEYTAPLPYQLQLHLIFPLSSKLRLNVGVRQYSQLRTPEPKLGLAIQVSPKFCVEPTLRIGSTSSFVTGLNMGLQVGSRLGLRLKSELFGSMLFPQKSTGQSLFLALNMRF